MHKPINYTDFYKTDHKPQYPKNTILIYSNFAPRMTRIKGIDQVVVFGLQYFIKEYLIERFNSGFFNVSKEKAIKAYKRRLDNSLGKGSVDISHIGQLHDLGYLPIKIKAMAEGSLCPIKVPFMSIQNTKPEFFWLTNFLETILSTVVWLPTTSATIANHYRKLLDKYAKETSTIPEFVDWQGHDFSMRGMGSLESACVSGAGHLLSFTGTDTIPSIDFLEDYYNADSDKELIGGSVPACYDNKTEVLTEKGFVKFSNLKKGTKVAQYLKDGSVEFVIPSEYYAENYSGNMIKWSSKGSWKYVDMVVTPNHKMVRVKNNKIDLFEAGDFSYRNRTGFSGKNYLPVAGVSKSESLEFSSFDQLRVAFQADGSLPSRSEKYKSGQIRFSLKKERKIKRLESILKETKLKYSKSEIDKRGYVNFWIKTNLIDFDKSFNWVSLQNSFTWNSAFINELGFWDGCFKNNCITYSNINKVAIDKIQSICAVSNLKTQYNKYQDKRTGYNRKPLHSLTIQKKNKISGDGLKREIIKYDNKVYCVSVPSKMLIVRRNQKIAICGNTEHSVMCMGTQKDEIETFKALINKIYPSGMISIVSDTWDFWKVMTEFLPILKEDILKREGKVVIRPDSGDPVDIICGKDTEIFDFAIRKGAIEVLWDTFGGTINDKGYKELDPHIGLIYGDSITIERATIISQKLKEKGFASTNVVYGIGSYTYQYNTRDTFGFAMKATYGELANEDGTIESREIYKDPKTDSGFKKSAKGLLRVNKNKHLKDQCTWEEENTGILQTVFEDGKIVKEYSLQEIRNKIKEENQKEENRKIFEEQ